MTALNRLVTILVALALIPIVSVMLLAPREAIELAQNGLDELYALIDPSPSNLQVSILVLVALLVDALLVLLLYLELRRPSSASVRVHRAPGSEAKIAVDSVSERLIYHLDRLSGVLDVVPVVIPHRRGVKISLEIEMADDEDVPACIEEIVDVTRRVVEQDMGLKLKGKPKLNLRTIERPGALASGAEWAIEQRQSTDVTGDEYTRFASSEEAGLQPQYVDLGVDDTQTDQTESDVKPD